jgi:hypothetical protein
MTRRKSLSTVSARKELLPTRQIAAGKARENVLVPKPDHGGTCLPKRPHMCIALDVGTASTSKTCQKVRCVWGHSGLSLGTVLGQNRRLISRR